MYSTKITKEQITSSSKYLQGGIHDDVVLTSVKMDKSPSGNNFLEVTFSKDASIVTHTEWEPKKFPNQDDDSFQERQSNQLGRLLQILSCYYDSKLFDDYECNTFTELAMFVKDKLQDVVDNKVVNIPVRLKVVYNSKGYTTLPNYSKYTFIEPMSVEKSTIEKVAKDLFERPIQADKEPSVDPLAKTVDTVTETPASNVNGLPF